MELYRYLPFHRFIQILFNKELTLISPSKWPDQYEQYWLKQLETEAGKEALQDYAKQFNGDNTSNAEKIEKLNSLICRNVYCLCFSKERDSEVLWNAHADNNRAIMIQTTEEKVLHIADGYNATVQEVKYDLEQADMRKSFLEKFQIQKGSTSLIDVDDLFLHKRKIFSYEQEIRFLVYGYGNKGPVLKLKAANLTDLIDGVMVHPLADEAHVSLIEMLCSKFGIEFLGKSTVYEFPQYMEEPQ